MRRQNIKVLAIQLKIVIPSFFQNDEDEDMQNNILPTGLNRCKNDRFMMSGKHMLPVLKTKRLGNCLSLKGIKCDKSE
jgi:hypothetical protein